MVHVYINYYSPTVRSSPSSPKAQPSPHPVQVGLKTTQKLYMAEEGISPRSKECER